MPVRGVGRPEVTSHSEIEEAAFRLFARYGFEGTTLDMIAAEVGVGRRTLFRYYASKNDIPWGQFDRTLAHFADLLGATSPDLPLWQAVHRGVVAFNDFPATASPSHAERMRLILDTPALQAHSVLRYAEWRRVIAEFVGVRLGVPATEERPVLVGQVSLALALSAYEAWLREPARSLPELVSRQLELLRDFLDAPRPTRRR